MTSQPFNCTSCGAPLVRGDDICPFCGEVVRAIPHSPPPPPPRVVPDVGPVAQTMPGVRRSEEEIAAAATEVPAWEDRKTFGFWASLWITWRESVFRPVEFFRSLPPRGGIGPALGFSVLFTALGLLLNIYWGTLQSALAGSWEEGPVLVFFSGLVTALLWLAFAIPLYVGALFTMAGVLHLCFMVVGAGRRGFEATFRAIGYSSGPAAFAIFPFFGALLGLVWGTVVLFIGMREVQRTTNGKATLAFLLPLFAFTAFVMLLSIVLAMILAGTDFGALE
ncbi:MAG: YIP1 family protein [Gemmatimonadota bacterium]|nr:MAG: YIP1 family protein [Gemmatimonadota bacterium]